MSFLFQYKWHVAFWMVYLTFWTAVSINGYHAPFFPALLTSLGWAVGQGTLNYWCIYRLFPVYFTHRRYWVFTGLLLAGLAASVFFIMGFQILVFALAGAPMSFSIGAGFGYVLLGNTYTVFIVIAIKSIRDRVRNERRTQLLEKEKTEHELHFLKSQMNPHFLFNAINSIYVLIRKDPELASHTLLKFADMLRYQLYECNSDRIPIEKEIVYLDNYIGLEKLRRGSGFCTEYQVGGEVRHFSIAPLLIIPFVENAFKYVSSFSDRPNKVAVNLCCRDELFELAVENTYDEESLIPRGADGGIGLENVRRRLELIYRGRHQLDIEKDGKTYSVLLKIPVQ
jgi:two-component system, LytTR family, sensor kinase